MKRLNTKTLSKHGGDSMMLIILIIICSIFFTIMNSSFLSMNSFSSIAKQIPEIGLFTMAMMLPMLVGGIDLSIIASANLASIFMSMYINTHIGNGGNNIGSMMVAILICVVVCVIVGFANGLIIAIFKIPAMLVTLGTQMVLTGIALGITKGGTLSGYPEAFKFIGNGNIAGIPTQFFIFVIASVILIVIMQMTSFGIKLQMYGSNQVATKYSGINETKLLIKTHMLSGVYVGIATVIMASRLNSASAGAAANYLMRTILIAVLGGVDPNGGKGKVSGVLWAVLLFQCMATGLNILRVNSYIIVALYGVILLLAVFVRTRKE